jgi:hypothetical protein
LVIFMIIEEADLDYCLDKAREIAEQYKLYNIAGDDPLRAVDKLTKICRTYLEKNIQVWELEINKDDSPVLGSAILLKEENSYDICHVAGLNYCWQRFVTCKELFHAILDEEKYRKMNISEHVDEVTVAFPEIDSTPGDSVIAEALAEIAAMEFLFPYECREREIAARDGNIDCRAVAERFKVPLVFVEKYLSQPYMEALGQFKEAK